MDTDDVPTTTLRNFKHYLISERSFLGFKRENMPKNAVPCVPLWGALKIIYVSYKKRGGSYNNSGFACFFIFLIYRFTMWLFSEKCRIIEISVIYKFVRVL